MPCSDVTETIQVTLDECDRLKDYFLSKRTCGQGVGAGNLLLEWLSGRSVEEILAYSAEQFLEDHPIEEELEEFLSLKHLFALQGVLEVLTGKQPGRREDTCAAAEISCENGDLIVTGIIKVDLVTEKIEACGNCRSCGNARSKKKVVFQ
ncbi:MAG: hypothetical protein K1Y02_02265 [Candidatus Hydrogenedentes bacterium]|nr:hypothetical protein [Candidatus Hydrogenedentota bacterium]